MTNQSKSMRVLVLGATGMLGNAVLRTLADDARYEVFGSARSAALLELLREDLRVKVQVGIDVERSDTLLGLFESVRPDAVINCVGLVKQLAEAEDPLATIPINSILPHRLSRLCSLVRARLVHISTDCVFSGVKGGYKESDIPDTGELYGRSKLVGEVLGNQHAITLRTSIIGHEIGRPHGLVEWFLDQTIQVKGYRRAIFSGIPTAELACIIRDRVLQNHNLHGLYHVGAAAIDKMSLLQLVATQYGRTVKIIPDDSVEIDRSLDSSRFRTATGYQPPDWPELVRRMHVFGK